MANAPDICQTGLSGFEVKSHISFEQVRFLFAPHCLGSESELFCFLSRADETVLSFSGVSVSNALVHIIEGAGESATRVRSGSVESGPGVGILSTFNFCSR